MPHPLIDISYLTEISKDPNYIGSVLDIYTDTMNNGLKQLKELIDAGEDMPMIGKVAHGLKSSAIIVKVKDVHSLLIEIEHTARGDKNIDTIKSAFKKIETVYNKVAPVIAKEREKINEGKALTII